MEFLYLDETNSTNTYCKEHLERIKDKTVVYTSKQTNGRGRFDRVWIDLGNENLFLSLVLKPSYELKPVYTNLTQYCALKLAKTFELYSVKPNIKWPNDILINGKKISGILAETVFSNNKLNGIIIGVGLNLNAKKNQFSIIDKPVTALNLEINKTIDKDEFLKNFTDNFFNEYDQFLSNGFNTIKEDYLKYVNFLGKKISFTDAGKKITGIAKNITDDGALVIDDKIFYTGDIN